MAPLPPESTGRMWVDYSSNGRQHSMQFRYSGSGSPDVSFLEAVDDILIALNPFMPTNWSFVDARYANPGSTVTNPLVFTPTTFAGLLDPKPAEAPAFVSLVGRDSLGKRVRLYALGAGVSPAGDEGATSDYRWLVTENASVAAMYSAVASSPMVTITGADPAWKPYLNLGYNAYWQRKVRP